MCVRLCVTQTLNRHQCCEPKLIQRGSAAFLCFLENVELKYGSVCFSVFLKKVGLFRSVEVLKTRSRIQTNIGRFLVETNRMVNLWFGLSVCVGIT